jgi:hypothetical protein
MFIVTLFSLKFNIIFGLRQNCFYRTGISRIRIRMDPHSFEKLDPDSHSPKKLDPDPHKVKAVPKHCVQLKLVKKSLKEIIFILCR